MSVAVSWVRRAAASLPLVALALPVVLIRDCSTNEESVRSGWQLLADGGWVFLAPALAYAAWRVVRPALPPIDAVGDRLSALQTWAVEGTLGFIGVVFPLLSTLFDTVSLKIGFWVQVVGWGLLWVTAAVNAGRAMVGLPRSPSGPTAQILVATWLRLAGLIMLLGPATYGLVTDDVAAGTVAFSVVVGAPLAAWAWALSITMAERRARRMTAALLVLAFAGVVALGTDQAPLYAVVPLALFTLVAGGALFTQSSETSAH